jgi:hypothetical protein
MRRKKMKKITLLVQSLLISTFLVSCGGPNKLGDSLSEKIVDNAE